jgi:glycosyltransferase involved in cell wall biosynthesis
VKLLFVSNLFPDTREPYRGLDNATLLHALRDRAEIRVVALRPSLPWQRRAWRPRPEDAPLQPQFLAVPYLPKIGHRFNHRLYARALRPVLASLVREWAPGVILVSWLFPDACAVARLQLEFQNPFVAIAQGSDAHQYLQISARREVMVRELARASAIVTRSAELARLLAEAGLAAGKLHTIYNGVDLERFRPPDPAGRLAAREAMAIPVDAPVIVFVGNFLPVKNPRLLLEAHARLLGTPVFRDTRLVLVGAGPVDLSAESLRLGTSARVMFAGRQDVAGVARAMEAADVLALSSDNEGVPNVMLEAFACGLPVVATRVGGISEVHRHDFLGKLVPARDAAQLGEALGEVLSRPRETARIAEYGRTFSWEATADAYREVLRAAHRLPECSG